MHKKDKKSYVHGYYDLYSDYSSMNAGKKGIVNFFQVEFAAQIASNVERVGYTTFTPVQKWASDILFLLILSVLDFSLSQNFQIPGRMFFNVPLQVLQNLV